MALPDRKIKSIPLSEFGISKQRASWQHRNATSALAKISHDLVLRTGGKKPYPEAAMTVHRAQRKLSARQKTRIGS